MNYYHCLFISFSFTTFASFFFLEFFLNCIPGMFGKKAFRIVLFFSFIFRKYFNTNSKRLLRANAQKSNNFSSDSQFFNFCGFQHFVLYWCMLKNGILRLLNISCRKGKFFLIFCLTNESTKNNHSHSMGMNIHFQPQNKFIHKIPLHLDIKFWIGIPLIVFSPWFLGSANL